MLMLAGCGAAQVAMAPPGQDAAGKQFDPPPPGMAAVYFYNPTTTGPVINVGAGAMIVGQLAPKTWMGVELGSGWHAMRCIVELGQSVVDHAGARRHRFVDVEMPPGAPDCTIRRLARRGTFRRAGGPGAATQ